MDKSKDVKILDTIGLVFSLTMIGLNFCFFDMFRAMFDEIGFMFGIMNSWWENSYITAACVLLILMWILFTLATFYFAVNVVYVIQWFRKKNEDDLLMNFAVARWMKKFPQKRYIKRIESETIGEKYRKQKLDALYNERRKLGFLYNLVGTVLLFAMMTVCILGISMIVTYFYGGDKLKNNEITWIRTTLLALIPLAAAALYSIMYNLRVADVKRKVIGIIQISTEALRKREYKKIISTLRKCGVLHIIVLLMTELLLTCYLDTAVFGYKLKDLNTGEIIETGEVTTEDFIRRINSTTSEEALRIIAESGAGEDGALCAILAIIGLALYFWIFLLLVVCIRKILGKSGGGMAIMSGAVMMGIHFVSGMLLFIKVDSESKLYGTLSKHGNLEAIFRTELIIPFVIMIILCVLYRYLHSEKLKKRLDGNEKQ